MLLQKTRPGQVADGVGAGGRRGQCKKREVVARYHPFPARTPPVPSPHQPGAGRSSSSTASAPSHAPATGYPPTRATACRSPAAHRCSSSITTALEPSGTTSRGSGSGSARNNTPDRPAPVQTHRRFREYVPRPGMIEQALERTLSRRLVGPQLRHVASLDRPVPRPAQHLAVDHSHVTVVTQTRDGIADLIRDRRAVESHRHNLHRTAELLAAHEPKPTREGCRAGPLFRKCGPTGTSRLVYAWNYPLWSCRGRRSSTAAAASAPSQRARCRRGGSGAGRACRADAPVESPLGPAAGIPPGE